MFPQLKHQKRVISKSLFNPSEEPAENKANTRTKLKRKFQEKSLVIQEFNTVDKTLPGTDKVLPLAYQSTSDETTQVSDRALHLACQNAGGSKVSEKTYNSEGVTKDEIKKETVDQQLEYSSKQNDTQSMISVSQSNLKAHKKYPERDSVAECRETVSPVRGGNLKSQRKSSNNGVRDQHRTGMSRENRDMHQTNHRESVGKSTLNYRNGRCQSRLPLDSRPEKNNRLHSRNMYERGSESKSSRGSFKGNNNRERSRSRSKCRSPKRQSRFEVQRDNSKKYMGRSRRSKSPEDIKKTFMDIMYGDKDRVIKKETASSSLMDIVFDKKNKAPFSEFVNASSGSLLPGTYSAPGSYPEPVYGHQFIVKAEKQDNYAQETLMNGSHRQPQFQANQSYLGNNQTDLPVPLANIKKEPQVQVGYMSNFAPSRAYRPQYNTEYQEIIPYNYNIS